MKVLVSRTEMYKMRKRMRKAYPKEHYELLWGKMVGRDTFHIYLFDQVRHKASRRWCEPEEVDHEISVDEAQKNGFAILGTIHSHPNYDDPTPSGTDFDGGMENGELVCGVVAVWKDRQTGQLRTKTRFWAPLLGVTAQYT